MILYELFGKEDHPVYQALSADNLERQYDFLESIVGAAIAAGRPMISTALISALNHQAICCLHVNAGAYRPCQVTVGGYEPPQHFRIPELMNAFINEVNRFWDSMDLWTLAAYCLWRLNHIHPFINGNGRTALGLCYFVICVKSGRWLQGAPILPELLRRHHDDYVRCLQAADIASREGEGRYLDAVRDLIMRLMSRQLGRP